MSLSNKHKSGFVNILGRPNAGKSTLINKLIGEKLAIVSPKAQTTRHRILGILNDDEYQIVFSDTPGIIKEPAYKLQEKMMKKISEALEDADIILFVADINQEIARESESIGRLKKMEIPIIVLINKIDESDQQTVEKVVEEWSTELPLAEILPISALLNFNLDILLTKIISILPEGPGFYPKDTWTDKSERFFVNEILREKILMLYDKEIPFSIEVVTENFKRNGKKIDIETTIYVERDSQKGIVIGHRGSMLSKLGADARKDLELFFGSQIYLGLYVKVKKNWRKNDLDLKRFGYD